MTQIEISMKYSKYIQKNHFNNTIISKSWDIENYKMYGMHIYNYKYIVNVNDKIAKFDCLFNGVTRMEMVWCDCTYPIILRSQEHTSLALYLSFGLCSTNLFLLGMV